MSESDREIEREPSEQTEAEGNVAEEIETEKKTGSYK